MASPALSCLITISLWATLSVSKSCAETLPFQLVLSCVVLYVCVGLLACHALGYHVFFLSRWFVVLHASVIYASSSFFAAVTWILQVGFMKLLLLPHGLLLPFFSL